MKFLFFSNKSLKVVFTVPLVFFFCTQFVALQYAGAQDILPVREYVNPDELVTFDRTAEFPRVLDVINEFAQENTGKMILDRTGTTASIEISIPPMHWRDALNLILRVKGLQLVEQPDFFEIVTPQSLTTQTQVASGQTTQTAQTQLASTATKEVRINAIFFEGNRRALSEIGVDWSTLTENTPDNAANFTDGTDQLPGTTGFSNQFVTVNSIAASSVSQNVFNSLINFGQIGTSGISVQALFSAFEADNLGEILAAPSVKVMDGQDGRIQVGQDFSIKQRDFAGNVTDNFVSTGTILEVTPTIIEQNDTTFIHLNVTAERSTAQPDPVSTIINKQETTTQAILIDGEATAMAGLYTQDVSEVRRGIPILKDLPGWLFGLRYLFGYNSTDYATRELVILIQAEIEPTIPDRFGQQFANKYEVLENERVRFRNELNDREEMSPIGSLDARETEEESSSPADVTPDQPEPEEAVEEPEPLVEEPEEEAVVIPEEGRQQIMDPELNIEPVQLDLGGGEEDSLGDARMDNRADSMSTSTTTDAAPSIESGNSVQLKYFIVGAAFASESNAIQFRDRLAKSDEGFDPVIIADPFSEFYYVAYRGYGSLPDAETALADIKQYHNRDAWLYTRNQ